MPIIVLLLFIPFYSYSQDWGLHATLPGEPICEDFHGHEVCLTDQNRADIYQLGPSTLEGYTYEGAKHVLDYPVSSTRMLLPEKALNKYFESDSRSALRRFIFNITKKITHFKSLKEVFKWMGLHDYPEYSDQIGPNQIPQMGELEEYPMGTTIFKNNQHNALTFSCAACHSSNLFGTKVIGLQNRFPRANEAFVIGKSILSKVHPRMFQFILGPDKEDYETYKETYVAMKSVALKKPLALGLDTSLAQVGLSLELRGDDEYATPKKHNPRRRSHSSSKNPLNFIPADSKPGVWWNLKYKTKWLLDGSIISGNPVHTNFLWNEIGRGADLKKLESWMVNNDDIIKELTSFVFSTKAPKFNDYFPKKINIEKAKYGEKLFLKNCKGCHGVYEKGWSNPQVTDYQEQLITTKTWYHKTTPVIDVGTDPLRHEGMKYFSDRLNNLKISKSISTIVKPQKGYVPPPLVGVWSRWPYFHNNSAPTLYDVLSLPENRTAMYIAVPAENKQVDFDRSKNGYPAPHLIRSPYKEDKEYHYDTSKKGLQNIGHDKMLLNDDGSEKFSHKQKLAIIEFLQTL